MEGFAAKHARDINSLADPDRFKRKRALDTLSTELFDAASRPAAPVRSALIFGDLLQPLCAIAGESVETNREAAIALLARAVHEDEGCTAVALPALLPLFTARVGRMPFAEDAEELRYSLARLLNALLARPDAAAALRTRVADTAEVVRTLAGDAFHSVKVEAAHACVHLARAVPEHLHAVASALARAAVLNLTHQRGPVRVVALSALHAVVPCAGESLPSLLSETVLPAMLSIRFDRTPSVRKQVGTMAGDWLTALPSHAGPATEHKLLHLLVALSADDTPEVSASGLAALEKGATARRAHLEGRSGGQRALHGGAGADLYAAAAAAAPEPGMAGFAASAALAEASAAVLSGSAQAPAAVGPVVEGSPAAAATAAASGLLPHPFVHRPGADARWLLQRALPAILPLILAELGDWTARVRIMGAGSLRSLVILVEGAATPHIDKMLQALITGSRDDEAEVRRCLGAAGQLIGVFTPAAAQLAVLLPILRGEVSGLAGNAMHAASTLAVLAAVLSSMPHTELSPHVPELAAVLALPSLAELEPTALRTQLAIAVAYTVQTGVAGGARGAPVNLAAATLDALLLALLHLQDTSAHVELLSSARASETALAAALHARSPDALFASSASRLVPLLTAGARGWAKASHERRVFDTLLRVHRPALAGRTRDEAEELCGLVIDAFAAASEPSREPELRVSLLALLDSFVTGSEGSGLISPTDSHRGQPDTLSHALAASSGHGSGQSTEEGVTAIDEALRSVLSLGGHSVSNALVDSLLAEGLAGRIVREVLLPNFVWRVGLVASTVRKVAVAVLLALARRRLLPLATLEPLAPSLLLPALTGVLTDEDATTRFMGVSAMAALLTELAGCLDYEAVRTIYPELLKRLDDANDSVRGVACTALGAFAGAAPREAMTGGPVEYTLETLLVHLDDAEGGVQATVYDACLPFVRLDVKTARRLVQAARTKHRHPGYCDRLLGYMDGLAAAHE